MALPVWMLLALVGATVAVPLVYIIITWEHEMICNYPVLPAPSDLGTKEFRWRTYLSGMTRSGWRKTVLRSPCPRITLQSHFALLSTDFAKMTTSMGFQELKLETIPFIFPQIAVSGLMLQLLGNSNFPTALTGLKIKALTICQLRPLDMRFRDKELKETDQEKKEVAAPEGLHCLMVLTEKRFLETEIEFSIQTDLFDDQGTVWQSTTCISVPFKQETLVVPLSATAAHLDASLLERSFAEEQTLEYSCSPHNLDEFNQVNVTNLDGTAVKGDVTPVMWLAGRTAAALQRQKRVPALPLLCSMVFDNEDKVPTQTRVNLVSSLSQEESTKDRPVTKVEVKYDNKNVVSGLLRTVGWVFEDNNLNEVAAST